MSTALGYIWYIFDKLINWFFNDTEMFTGVTLGWVIVVISVFYMLIRSLLNIPRGARSVSTSRLTQREDK